MFQRMYISIADRVGAPGLFRACVAASAAFHLLVYAGYYVVMLPPDEVSSDEIQLTQVDIDFEDMDFSRIGGSSNPAPVEKSEWIEGAGKTAPDAPVEDVNINALSGDGTDRDGFLYSFNGDKPPTPIIDFDLQQYFPPQAKAANIRRRTVTVLVQVDEHGLVQSARRVSPRTGHGFDEAAMEVIKRLRFSPGYVKGKPTRMAHEQPIRFELK